MVSPELAPGPETVPAPPGRRPSGKTMKPEAATDQDADGRHQALAGRWRTMERKATRIADMLDEPTPGMPIAVDLEPRRCHPDTASACQLRGTVREPGAPRRPPAMSPGPPGRGVVRGVCGMLVQACTARGRKAVPGWHLAHASLPRLPTTPAVPSSPVAAGCLGCRRIAQTPQPRACSPRSGRRSPRFRSCRAGLRAGPSRWQASMTPMLGECTDCQAEGRYPARSFPRLALRCGGGWLPNWLPSAVNCGELRRTVADVPAGQRRPW